MPELIIREAIARGLREALDGDPMVFLMGEDIGAYGGAYAVTRGFLDEYGPERIRDTPISESAIVGSAVGAAIGGLKPIVEIMTINFTLLAMDQIVNHAAKLRYMSDGQFTVPIVIRTVTGGGGQLGPTHSQSFENWFASVPGLKVVVPATPYYDALGLLRTAVRDENPIIYTEHSLLYTVRGEVPDEWYEVPFGRAAVRRPGSDVTIVAYSGTVRVALEAAEALASSKGKEAEVIDLRTLRPLDMGTVVESVKKTNRAVVVEETWRTGGFAAEIASSIQEQAFDYLYAPVARVGGVDVPTPYSAKLEAAALPSADRVIEAIQGNFGT
jgi:pyruvate dehydrogenase E1 component beta subunit